MNKIYPHERKWVFLFSIMLFTVVFCLVLLKTARDALFLSSFPIKWLPVAMTLTTLTVISLLALHRKYFLNRFDPKRAFSISTFFFLIIIPMSWFLIQSLGHPGIFVFYIITGLFATFVPMHAWIVVETWFNVREARRVLGFIGASAIGGSVAGGASARWLSHFLPPEKFVFVVGGVLTLSFIASRFIRVSAMEKGHDSQKTVDKGEHFHHFIPLFAIFLFTGGMLSTVVDFIFKSVAQASFVDSRALASFFGLFHGAVGIGTLIFQIFFTTRILNGLGLRLTLLIPPLSLSTLMIFLPFWPNLWFSSLVRGFETAFKNSLYRTSTELIFMVFPQKIRPYLKAKLEPIGYQLSDFVAGLTLMIFLLFLDYSVHSILWGSTLLALAWLGFGLALIHEYPQMLAEFLVRRQLIPSMNEITLRPADLHSTIPILMARGRREIIPDLLHFIETLDIRTIGSKLVPLLRHSDPVIRLAALHALMHQRGDYTEKVLPLLHDDHLLVRIEAVHYLCMHGHGIPQETLRNFLHDADPGVRIAALGCAIRDMPRNLRSSLSDDIMQILKESLATDQPEIRVEIAHFLKDIDDIGPYLEVLKKLLKDERKAVRRAAYRVIEKHRPAELLQSLFIQFISGPDKDEKELLKTLVSYQDKLISFLEASYNPDVLTQRQRNRLYALVAQIGHPSAVRWLLSQYKGLNFHDGGRILELLNLVKYRNSKIINDLTPLIRQLVVEEYLLCNQWIDWLEVLQPDEKTNLYLLFLSRVRKRIERILRLLSLVYPHQHMETFHSLWLDRGYTKDTSFAWMETALNKEDWGMVKSILDRLERFKTDQVRKKSERSDVVKAIYSSGDELLIMCLNEYLGNAHDFGFVTRRGQSDRINPVREEPTMYSWGDKKMNDQDTHKTLTVLEKMEQIRRMNIFRSLDPDDAFVVANLVETVVLPENTTIFQEGDPADAVYYLYKGEIETIRKGGHVVVIHEGEEFGTYAVLAGKPRLFTARTVKPSVLLRMNAHHFWNLLEEYPSICRAVLVQQAEIIDELTRDPR